MMKRLLFAIMAMFAGFSINLSAEEVNPVNSKQSPTVVIETSVGSIEVKLFPETAPKTCENFLGLIQNKYYDGQIFHRIIKKFMIQGGDPTGTGAGGESIWGKSFGDECAPALKFDRPGLLAMANRGPNTNGSQFFITTVATPWLNMKHTIFGEVVKGYDVVQKMESVHTDARDRPIEPVKIIKAYLKQ
jgi:peptidylprolyl isomerase